jgi:two-component system cell cycle response regulator
VTRPRGKGDDTLRVDPEEAARLRASISAPSSAALVMIHGPELGRRHVVEGACILGRDPDASIPIDSPLVSRHHAAVQRSGPGEWVIADLGSTNGTQVNDEVILGERPLKGGDIVRVGPVAFKFMVGEDVEARFLEQIYDLSALDGLTRVHNRRSLDEFLRREVARSQRHGNPLCFALLDIDHFKVVNDTHGHQAGDDVLRGIAARIGPTVRAEHLFARYGGEEFALVLPESTPGGAWIFCERVRRSVSGTPFSTVVGAVAITLSIGLAEFEGDGAEALVARADEALYEAKSGGRDRVVTRERRPQ